MTQKEQLWNTSIILTFLILIFQLACSSDDNKPLKSKNPCANFEWINSISKDWNAIDYNFNEDIETLYVQMYKQDSMECCTDISFKVPYVYQSNKINLPFHCFLDCVCHSDNVYSESYFLLLINSKAQILAGGNPLNSSDSITYYVKTYYSNYYKSDSISRVSGFDIYVGWDNKVPIKKLMNFFDAILTGYITFLQEQSVIIFKKSFCELTNLEIKKLTEKYPFVLRIVMSGYFDDKGKYIIRLY